MRLQLSIALRPAKSQRSRLDRGLSRKPGAIPAFFQLFFSVGEIGVQFAGVTEAHALRDVKEALRQMIDQQLVTQA